MGALLVHPPGGPSGRSGHRRGVHRGPKPRAGFLAAHPTGRPSAGRGLADLADLLAGARRRLHEAGRSSEDVDWAVLLDGPLPALVEAGRLTEASAIVEAAVGVDIAP